jgi:Lrp/AsnC family transcriptional regulator for asnA, asnC and gidA
MIRDGCEVDKLMDELDFAIIEFLQKDGRKHYTEIAKELNVTEGTVRNRVARLMDSHVMQVIGMIDPHRAGYDAPALIGVSVQPAQLDETAARIADIPEVSYLIMVSGEYDLIVEVFCRDREHLTAVIRDRLQKIPGILRTQTFMILHTYKMAHGAQPVLSNS